MRAASSSLILLLAASCGPTFTDEELAGGQPEAEEEQDEGGGAETAPTPIPATNYAWDDLGGCSVGGASGVCVDTYYETCWGTLYSGACPGDAAVVCCVDDYDTWGSSYDSSAGAGWGCNVASGSGVCIDTNYEGCYGSLYSGACPGGGNVQCCVDDYWSGSAWGTSAGAGSSCLGGDGVCIDTNYEGCYGDLYSGACAGGGNILCCVDDLWGGGGGSGYSGGVGASCDGGAGTCIDTYYESCPGYTLSGLCPGDSWVQCCVW